MSIPGCFQPGISLDIFPGRVKMKIEVKLVMIHEMNLTPQPFALIADGRKTIELRLLDEKRQKIAVGDTLIFKNTEDPALQLRCVVKKLHCFASFAALYAALPLEKCGYLPEELADAKAEDMALYYPPEKQAEYGVVGIEVQRVP